MKFKHHISHIKPKSWFRGIAFLSVMVPSLTKVLGLISISRYYCSGQSFQFQGGKTKYCTKKHLQHVIRYAIRHFLPPNSKCTLSLSHTDTKYAPVVSHSAHRQTPHTLSACLPESQSLFPQTILHCFLQSPNWLYPDPAHRPESETIKNSIYIPAASTWAPTACDYTHQPSSSVCDFKLQAVFHIYLNVARLESAADRTAKSAF